MRDSQVIDVGGSHWDDEREGPDHANQPEQGQRLDHKGDQVEVLTGDHPAPNVIERMRGRDMVPISGGTQALKRTINVDLDIQPHTPTAISVPRPYAAVILKAAAYLADSRDRDRHLYDAAALLARIEATLTEKESLGGSDRRRIRTLTQRLPGDHPAWLALDQVALVNAQAALRILSSA